jgi:hypothetical protein
MRLVHTRHHRFFGALMAGNMPEGAPGSIAALLDGRTPSSDPQAEAYRQLLVHTCNQWHGPMPFLFEEIDDYTELLMPEDLLSQSSILGAHADLCLRPAPRHLRGRAAISLSVRSGMFTIALGLTSSA